MVFSGSYALIVTSSWTFGPNEQNLVQKANKGPYISPPPPALSLHISALNLSPSMHCPADMSFFFFDGKV